MGVATVAQQRDELRFGFQHQAEHRRHEEQSEKRRHNQATKHNTAEAAIENSIAFMRILGREANQFVVLGVTNGGNGVRTPRIRLLTANRM